MRRTFIRLVAVLLASVVGAVGLTAAPATAAPVATAPAVVVAPAALVPADGPGIAVTCFGGAVWQYTTVSPTVLTAPGGQPFSTTSRCLDINMRKSTTVTWDVQVCVVFVDHTSSCNYLTTLSTSWQTIATNVADNSRFVVNVYFSMFPAKPTTAMQLAF
jgi:hypothetical protein